MAKVLILGAAGRIARLATDRFVEDGQDELTLYLRQADRVSSRTGDGARIVEGDVLDTSLLEQTAVGKNVVYANLAGDDIADQADSVVRAMEGAGVDRLIWISTLGIYDEVPGAFGQWNRDMLDGYLDRYRDAADVIEASGLDYTVIRPAWLTDRDEVGYELTHKGEAFRGTEVSRASVAALVVELAHNPRLEARGSVGIDKPGTDGDKPAWY